jgi:hypothetical protein
MDVQPPAHPVLRSLAVLRAARDFGLPAEAAEALARRVPIASGDADALAEAAAAALLEARWAQTG